MHSCNSELTNKFESKDQF